MRTSLALVPTKVLILRICLIALKEFDVPASLWMAAMDAGGQFQIVGQQNNFPPVEFVHLCPMLSA